MRDKAEDKARQKREALQIVRLERMADVIYAIKNHRLLLPEVTEQFAYQLRDRILAEPITAIITIPVAFVGPILWQISWLCYPLVVVFVRHGRKSTIV